MKHNFERLQKHILSLSESSDFHEAKNEWELIGFEINAGGDNCPCGQSIKEVCHLQNRLNNHRTYVDNICVFNFFTIYTGNLFAGLKRIAQDDSANAGEYLKYYACELGYISEKESCFLSKIKNNRNLSDKQLARKQKINRHIVRQCNRLS